MTWWKRKNRVDELERELRVHLELEAEERQQEGFSSAEAEMSARRLFGNVTRIQEEIHEMWTWMWLDNLVRDLRYGWRGLYKSPVFTLTAALSLALGTGATLIVCGVLESAFFNSVTAKDIGRLKKVDGDGQRFSYLHFEQLSASAPALADFAAYHRTNLSFSSGDELKSVAADVVSGNFFQVLGVAPVIGRSFGGDEQRARNQPRVVVLSHGFWQREFNGDIGVLGRAVKVNREPFTVIGVLPPSYRSIHGYGITSDLYAPISSLLLGELDRADNERLELICRLRADASAPQVESSLLASMERWKQQFPAEIDKQRKYQVRLSPLAGLERLRNDGIPMEMALFLAFLILSGALVLLIACGNVGSLLLARGAKRSREFEVRRALGAPRFHLMRQLFVETFLLAVLGAGFGLALYFAASSLIDKIQPSLSLPVEVHLHLDLRLLVLTASVTLLATLLVGLTPAMQTRQRYALVSARQVGSALPLRRMLVVTQFALSFVPLVSAALLLRSLARIAVVDPGFDSKHVLIAEPSLQLREYSRQQSQQFFRAALAEIERLPDVRSVSGASTIPLGLEHSVTSMKVGDRIVPRVHTNNVTADYFRTMGIRLVQGRQFDETDREGGRPVAIVNDSFARSYLQNQPLNAGILVPQRVPGQPEPKWVGVVVVGVVADSKYGTLGEDPMPALYWPWTQQHGPLTLLIQSDSPQSNQLAVRNALAQVGGQVPVKLQLMEERIAGALLPSRIASGLLGAIGTLGLILAAVGIYGVMAYSVGQRSGEIGLRLALGATPMQVLQMTLRDALKLAFVGLLLGLGFALVATRLLSGILASGVSVIDPLSLGSVGVLLSLTALCAALLPSWRASRVDPAVALRSE